MTNRKDIPFGVGVIVVKDGKILTGTRTDNGLICGPGGHMQAGEAPREAALRELEEEFSIKANNLYQLGAIQDPQGEYKPSTVFLCTGYTGDPTADGTEMENARFQDVQSLQQANDLVPYFAASLVLLFDKLQLHTDGGPGSGNWGHSSVEGVRGGSAPGGGTANRLGTKEGGYTSEAKAWAENKKKNKQAASGGSSSNGGLKKALESGDPEQLKQAVKDAKPGQIVKYTNSIHSYDYMKTESGDWINLNDGYEFSSETLEKFAASQTQKFSPSDLADQDFEACQKKFDTAMEVDHSAKKPGQDTYDKVLDTAHELPTGAKYESPDGEVYIKLADGTWEYDGYNVTEEDLAKNLTDAVHGGTAGFKKHAYGKKAPESSGLNFSKKAPSDAFDEEKYSQERKDNATWEETKQEIHDMLVGNSGEEWKNASEAERDAIYDYTSYHYKKMNDALYRPDTDEFLSDQKDGDEIRKRIDGATDYLDKCKTKMDVWAQRGTSNKNAPSIFGISEEEFEMRFEDNDFNDLVGKTIVQEGFLSSSPHKGSGFSGNMVLNMYIPEGSHAAYAEPFSANGDGNGRKWDGTKESLDFNNKGQYGEFELLIQRGSTFKITKVEKKDGKLYVDVDVATVDKNDLKSTN